MSDISEWSTVEAENTHIDELTLSGESGQYINKLMCAIKGNAQQADAAFVHKNGNEEVSGEKVFLDNIFIGLSDTDFSDLSTTYKNKYLGFVDKNKAAISFFQVHVRKTMNSLKMGCLVPGDTQTAMKDAPCVAFWLDNAGVASFASANTASLEACNLGQAANPWTEIFASNAQINTSDARLKEALAPVPDAVLDAWGDVDWRQFKMCEAVQRKGEAARLHTGAVAQQIGTAFQEHGLDASQYGLFCHDEWAADEAEGIEAGDRYSIRYVEALCMEAAYQRRRADRLEERIEALEAVLHGNN